MKKLLVLAVLLSGVNVLAADKKPLVTSSSISFLTFSTNTLTLMDDGYVYSQEGGGRVKRVGKVKDQAQLDSIIAAIAEIPADAKLRALTSAEKKANEECNMDGSAQMTIHSDRFYEGNLIIRGYERCQEIGLGGSKAYLGEAIIKMMSSLNK